MSAGKNNQARYEKLQKLGEGTYGVVYKGKDVKTGEFVAIKRIKLDHSDEGVPATTLREVSMLKQLRHPCIVHLLNAKYQEGGRLYLIFEFVEQDMKSYLDNLAKPPSPLTIKKLMYQFICGLHHCHVHRILHRDLKPQNLLIGANDVLKIADFGLGREHNIPIDTFTHEVVTLWYRAPEILLGTKKYSGAVDIWSVACIFGEFFNKEAIFMGDCEIDQLFQIFKHLGTPNESIWPGCEKLKDFKPVFPQWTKKPLKNTVQHICDEGIDLMESCFKYRPADRIVAADARMHPYFSEVAHLYDFESDHRETFI